MAPGTNARAGLVGCSERVDPPHDSELRQPAYLDLSDALGGLDELDQRLENLICRVTGNNSAVSGGEDCPQLALHDLLRSAPNVRQKISAIMSRIDDLESMLLG